MSIFLFKHSTIIDAHNTYIYLYLRKHARKPYPYERLQDTEPALHIKIVEVTTGVFVADGNASSH